MTFGVFFEKNVKEQRTPPRTPKRTAVRIRFKKRKNYFLNLIVDKTPSAPVSILDCAESKLSSEMGVFISRNLNVMRNLLCKVKYFITRIFTGGLSFELEISETIFPQCLSLKSTEEVLKSRS